MKKKKKNITCNLLCKKILYVKILASYSFAHEGKNIEWLKKKKGTSLPVSVVKNDQHIAKSHLYMTSPTHSVVLPRLNQAHRNSSWGKNENKKSLCSVVLFLTVSRGLATETTANNKKLIMKVS